MNKSLLQNPKFLISLFKLVGILFYAEMTQADTAAVEEYIAKSALTLSLVRYTDWPPASFNNDNSTINLCLLTDEFIQKAFSVIDNKKVGDKVLSVRNINQTKNLDQCHVVFISAETTNILKLSEECYRRGILTIGESDDFLRMGGMVYLEMNSDKINLHINPSATQKAGVRISARVLKLAHIYNP